jgi:hypothetical protein
MTPAQFFDKLMPAIAPLDPQQRATAFALALEHLRGKDEVDEALANKLADELRARFNRPLA